jgi:hypothetical protein
VEVTSFALKDLEGFPGCTCLRGGRFFRIFIVTEPFEATKLDRKTFGWEAFRGEEMK